MAKTAKTAAPASYEAALAELEQWVSAMENGQLPLDQLLHAYQRGADLLTHCREQLQAVEQQVKVLDEGTLKAWEDR
ncbi:MAG: exodeoxyribonuclease VII small subunit [Burkholderiales bacterium]|uniref:exodeoxyribonuclease VII small subunit n=1 Tax=Inhella sp. TaxID=1921806 RepID=UPI001AC25298|nr:exodeoxyribonuclease VII small subunit [Burkholderiales bacterium]